MRRGGRTAAVVAGAAAALAAVVVAVVVLAGGSGIRAEPAAPPAPIDDPACEIMGPPHPNYDRQQLVTDVLLPLATAETDLYSGACIDHGTGAVMLFVTDAVRGEELVAVARKQGAPAEVPIEVVETPYSERELMVAVERAFASDAAARLQLVTGSVAGNYQGIVLTTRRELSPAEQAELSEIAGMPVLFRIGEGGVPA